MINSATAGAPEPSPAEDGNSLIDLSTILDKSACYARNENSGFPWGNLFIGDSRLGMQSDADEHLIIHLSFQEFVRVCRFCVEFATLNEHVRFIYNVKVDLLRIPLTHRTHSNFQFTGEKHQVQ